MMSKYIYAVKLNWIATACHTYAQLFNLHKPNLGLLHASKFFKKEIRHYAGIKANLLDDCPLSFTSPDMLYADFSPFDHLHSSFSIAYQQS